MYIILRVIEISFMLFVYISHRTFLVLSIVRKRTECKLFQKYGKRCVPGKSIDMAERVAQLLGF